MKMIIGIILTIVLIITSIFCFTGCAELINTEIQEVDATVTDIYHRAAWVQMMSTGKTMIPISHPAKYEVTFTYEDVTLTVDDKELYDYYKDKIGTTVKCDLITEYYDNGTTRQKLKLKEK